MGLRVARAIGLVIHYQVKNDRSQQYESHPCNTEANVSLIEWRRLGHKSVYCFWFASCGSSAAENQNNKYPNQMIFFISIFGKPFMYIGEYRIYVDIEYKTISFYYISLFRFARLLFLTSSHLLRNALNNFNLISIGRSMLSLRWPFSAQNAKASPVALAFCEKSIPILSPIS